MTKSKKKVIVGLIVLILISISAFFTVNFSAPKKTLAESEYTMIPGMSIHLESNNIDGAKVRLQYCATAFEHERHMNGSDVETSMDGYLMLFRANTEIPGTPDADGEGYDPTTMYYDAFIEGCGIINAVKLYSTGGVYDDNNNVLYYRYVGIMYIPYNQISTTYHYRIGFIEDHYSFTYRGFRLVNEKYATTVRYLSINQVARSVQQVAQATLNDPNVTLSEQHRVEFVKMATGFDVNNAETYSTYSVSYKKRTAYNTYETVTTDIIVDTDHFAMESMLTTDFLCTFFPLIDGNAPPLNSFDVYEGNRLQYQVKGIIFNHNGVNNSAVVEYYPYYYYNFTILISNTSTETETYIGSEEVVVNFNENEVKMYFYNDELAEYLYGYGLLYEKRIETFITSGCVTVEIEGETVIATLNISDLDSLANTQVRICCITCEDTEYSATLEYMALEGETANNAEVNRSVLLSTLRILSSVAELEEIFGVDVECYFLGNVKYYKFDGIEKTFNYENDTCVLTISYIRQNLLKLTNNINSNVKYQAIAYSGQELDVWNIEGYRIDCIEGLTGGLTLIQNFNYLYTELNYLNQEIATGKIYTVKIFYNDEYIINLLYLKNYKESFAELKNETYTIPASESEITESLLCEITGLNTMTVLLSDVSHIDIEQKDNGVFNVSLRYHSRSLRTITYDGYVAEQQVYLTSYSNWTETIGQDWTIMFLNTENNTYFTKVNEIDQSRLYGYFTTVVFRERVSDFNYYFKRSTSDGAITVFKTTEVVGSEFYKFAAENRMALAVSGAILGGVVGGIPGAIFGGILGGFACGFSEILNSNNATYFTAVIFLDISTLVPYYARSGADNAYDTDTAAKNRVQDAGDAVKGAFESVGSFFSSIWDSIKIYVYIVLILIVVLLIVWIISKLK